MDEEDFCAQCLIQYEGDSANGGDNGYDMTMSDAEGEGSHHENEEDLEDFVVDDNQVDFESSIHDAILDDEPILLDSDNDEEGKTILIFEFYHEEAD